MSDEIEEGIVYHDNEKFSGNFDPSKVTNPNKIWNTHHDNYKYLQFIHKSSKDAREKIQAGKEMDKASSKMKYWEKHPLFSRKEAEKYTSDSNRKWAVKESVNSRLQRIEEAGSFGDAFKAARERGMQVFSHGGKSFNTRKAGESNSSWKKSMDTRAAAIKTATPTGPGGRGRPTSSRKPPMAAAGSASSSVGTPPAAKSSATGSASLKPKIGASGSSTTGTPSPAKSSVRGSVSTPRGSVDVNKYVGSVAAAKPDLASALAARAAAEKSRRASAPPPSQSDQDSALSSALAAKAASMRAGITGNSSGSKPVASTVTRAQPSGMPSVDVPRMMGRSTATPALSSALAAKAASMRNSMKKEEVEDISEISKRTAARYIDSAASDLERRGRDHGRSKSTDPEHYAKIYRKSFNRKKGISTAVNKIAGNYAKVPATNEETKMNEGLKLKSTHTSSDGKRVAKVYRDSEWDEYQVHHYTDGKHNKKADYHTDDKEDAHGTAKHFVRDLKEDAEQVDELAGQDPNNIYANKKVAKDSEIVTDDPKKHKYGGFGSGSQAHREMMRKIANGRLKPRIVRTEEVEQIDEVGDTERGQNALRDYMRKSAKSYTHNDERGDEVSNLAGKFEKGGKMHRAAKELAGKRWDKAHSRMIGMIRAGKRIKEDLDEGKTWKSDSEDGYAARKGVKDRVKKFAKARKDDRSKREVQEDLSPEVRSLNKKKDPLRLEQSSSLGASSDLE